MHLPLLTDLVRGLDVPESFRLSELQVAVEAGLGSPAPTEAKVGPPSVPCLYEVGSNRRQETEHVRQQLLAALACLRCRGRIVETSTDHSVVQVLARVIARTIGPVITDGAAGEDDDLPGGMSCSRRPL